MLASYVLDPGRRSHGLDLLASSSSITHDDPTRISCGKGKDAVPFDVVPVAARATSQRGRGASLRLRERFEPQLAQHDSRASRDIEVPLVACSPRWSGTASRSTSTGSARSRSAFARERERVEQEIYVAAGSEFNINSNPQLREILFEQLGLPVLKKTATGPSTDASVLQELAEEGHELPVLLMEYRELSKLESTYIDALPELVNPRTGRLHTSFNQTVAATGRLSSSDPNLQNIPIRRELGRDIRRGFVPAEGLEASRGRLLADRAAAAGAPVTTIRRSCRRSTSGGDIHRQTAALIFDVPLDAVTSRDARAREDDQLRHDLRAGSRTRSSRQLQDRARRGEGVHRDATSSASSGCARTSTRRWTMRASTATWRPSSSAGATSRSCGTGTSTSARSASATAANSPIQGSAADLIKIAMIRIHDAATVARLGARMLLQVHDELVFEVPPEVEAVTVLVRDEMEGRRQPDRAAGRRRGCRRQLARRQSVV